MSSPLKIRERFRLAAEIEATTPITVGVVPTAAARPLAHGRTPEHLALAKLVELRRRSMGMTTLELSERAHVPHMEIRLLESGVVNPLVFERLPALAQALQVREGVLRQLARANGDLTQPVREAAQAFTARTMAPTKPTVEEEEALEAFMRDVELAAGR